MSRRKRGPKRGGGKSRDTAPPPAAPADPSHADVPRRGLRRSRPISIVPEVPGADGAAERRRKFFTRAGPAEPERDAASPAPDDTESPVRRRWRWFRSSAPDARPATDMPDTEARAEAAKTAAAELRGHLSRAASRPAARPSASHPPGSGTSRRSTGPLPRAARVTGPFVSPPDPTAGDGSPPVEGKWTEPAKATLPPPFGRNRATRTSSGPLFPRGAATPGRPASPTAAKPTSAAAPPAIEASAAAAPDIGDRGAASASDRAAGVASDPAAAPATADPASSAARGTSAVPAASPPASTVSVASTERAASSGEASTKAAETEAAPTEAAPTEAAPTEAAPTEAAPSTEGAASTGGGADAAPPDAVDRIAAPRLSSAPVEQQRPSTNPDRQPRAASEAGRGERPRRARTDDSDLVPVATHDDDGPTGRARTGRELLAPLARADTGRPVRPDTGGRARGVDAEDPAEPVLPADQARGARRGRASSLRRWRRPLTEMLRPPAWQRHDLLVVLIAVALFATGAVAQRRIARPSLQPMSQLGLHVSRPSGWLPPRRVGRPTVGLAAGSDAAYAGRRTGDDEPAPVASTLPYHIVIQSARDPLARIEIRIAERPTTGNLRSALVLERVSRHGEAHWAADSTDRTIGGRDWVRTEYRYAYKGSKTDAPRIATGIEYALVNGRLLYTVTIHGSEAAARQLEALLVPTLSIDANHPAAVAR